MSLKSSDIVTKLIQNMIDSLKKTNEKYWEKNYVWIPKGESRLRKGAWNLILSSPTFRKIKDEWIMEMIHQDMELFYFLFSAESSSTKIK